MWTTAKDAARLYWTFNAISNLVYQEFFSQLKREKSVLKNKFTAKEMGIEWLKTYFGEAEIKEMQQSWRARRET